ncbi:bacteriohopanetetrol glucosamine biosynthesis glycosyltransferase HpnI [Roseiterribacter gracilis]|uniref:Glycosyl transferase n=1 Tax=Roseiterribacter gracilis TaxID=2812848 RepID=A0A8S8XBX3_9PROT|nr:glycosyl transferase [Rhodospirillales bacterium TMPK1]
MTTIFTYIGVILCLAGGAGVLYQLAVLVEAHRFFRIRPRTPSGSSPVTVLMPLYGDEPGLAENLRAVLAQDWPEVQLVCGVQRTDDAAISVVREIQHELPSADLVIVVNGQRHGTNAKVSNLTNMLVAAKHAQLVLVDSDMRPRRDWLRAIVGELETAPGGIVTCLYAGRPVSRGIWSRLGAQAIDHGFFPAALLGWRLGKRGCFGATIALERATLERVGGFARIADELADDYALGAAVVAQGGALRLVPHLIDTGVNEPDFRRLWAHELRWGRTIRTLDPAGYAGSGVAFAVPWALLGAACLGFSAASCAVLACAILARLALVWRIDRGLSSGPTPVHLILLRDALSVAAWIGVHFGRTVAWRDHAFQVERDGRLVDLKGRDLKRD